MILSSASRAVALALVGSVLAASRLSADMPPPPIRANQLLPLSKLDEAQKKALAAQKPIGFLLTYPYYFVGGQGFSTVGAGETARFYNAFNGLVVLVNVDHTAGDLDRLPAKAKEGFDSPEEGGHAPCLCLVNPTLTKLIIMIPLYNKDQERNQAFQKVKAMIADKASWLDPAPAK